MKNTLAPSLEKTRARVLSMSPSAKRDEVLAKLDQMQEREEAYAVLRADYSRDDAPTVVQYLRAHLVLKNDRDGIAALDAFAKAE